MATLAIRESRINSIAGKPTFSFRVSDARNFRDPFAPVDGELDANNRTFCLLPAQAFYYVAVTA